MVSRARVVNHVNVYLSLLVTDSGHPGEPESLAEERVAIVTRPDQWPGPTRMETAYGTH